MAKHPPVHPDHRYFHRSLAPKLAIRLGPHQERLLRPTLPINVSLVQTRPDHRRVWREKLGLKSNAPVLGYFGTWGASKQPEWIFAAWRHARATGIPAVLVLLGGDPPQNISEDERPFFRSLGYIPEVEVSLALQAFDLLLLPFEDGVSERRTSFTAGLSHGTPILTTVGHGTGTTLRSARFIASVPVNSPSDYPLEAVRLLGDPNRLSKLASDSIQAYHQSFSWEIVTKRLLKRLGSRPQTPGWKKWRHLGTKVARLTTALSHVGSEPLPSSPRVNPLGVPASRST